jgi:hypothetical protein
MTNRPRKAFACAFMPEGSIFNGRKDVLPDDYFKSLKPGDILNNDDLHPLIWRRPGTGGQKKAELAGVA